MFARRLGLKCAAGCSYGNQQGFKLLRWDR